MCTLSYEKTSYGYRVLFSRDESIARKEALPPSIFGPAIMPVDAEKGGTWISTNAHGLTFCLLNDYQFNYTPAVPSSRGNIVKQFSHCSSKAAVKILARQFNCDDYPGFKVVVIGEDFEPFQLLRGDGELIEAPVVRWPISSSSYASDVSAVREQYFTAAADLDAFHCSHLPSKGAYSPCVHRTDVKTVSLTIVSVSQSKVSMAYKAGSPCEAGETVMVESKRVNYEVA